MKAIALFAALFVSLSSVLAQQAGFVVGRLEEGLQGKTTFLNAEYLVAAPQVEAGEKLPLLIYLHGSGGRGKEVQRVRGQVMGVWRGIEQFGKGPCIVVAPQCLDLVEGEQKSIWMPEDLELLLQHLKATLPVDAKRVYLTGNSMGGYGCWVWGGHHPEHFAAIAPVSGGTGRGGPKDVTPDLEKWAAQLAKVPVYAFVGGKDAVVPMDRSERMIAAIREAGGKEATLKVYPEEGHGAGRVVYSTAEYYEWLFTQVRE